MTAGANIRQSLMNANTATTNLADATEAVNIISLSAAFSNGEAITTLPTFHPKSIATNVLLSVHRTVGFGYPHRSYFREAPPARSFPRMARRS